MKLFSIQVLNYHLDGYGHVNNARYLEFLEAARWDFFKQHNLQECLRQANLVVSHIDIRYRSATHLGDELMIRTQLISVQSRQIILQQSIEQAESKKKCTHAQVTLMLVNAKGQIFRLPDALFNYFVPLLER